MDYRNFERVGEPYKIGQRRSFALSRTDWVQMLLGVLTVPLLINHIALVGVFKTLNQQFQPDYGLLFAIFWKYMPANALLQVLARFIRGGRVPRGTPADTGHDAEKAL